MKTRNTRLVDFIGLSTNSDSERVIVSSLWCLSQRISSGNEIEIKRVWISLAKARFFPVILIQTQNGTENETHWQGVVL